MSPLRITPHTVLPLLRRYFYSGWAFLMPYLLVYLLYYVTKWPVNSGVRSQEPGVSTLTHPASWVPCLLHVYWALHAIHGVLAGLALWSWIRAQSRGVTSNKCSATGNDPHPYPLPLKPYHSQPTPYPLNLITRIAPWFLLALLFYIPGVYLEWPSDPWMHLERITSWANFNEVGQYPAWKKSSYLLIYSLVVRVSPSSLLQILDYYYTAVCLLLCWQYYRFSRACGLGERSSMVFVIIQALLFGNNIFSFYRYYGISSSIYAQLGAVALTRIVLEWAAKGTKLDPLLQKVANHEFNHRDTETQSRNADVGRGVPAEASETLKAKITKHDLETQSPHGARQYGDGELDLVHHKDTEAQRQSPHPIARILNWFSSCLHTSVVQSPPPLAPRPSPITATPSAHEAGGAHPFNVERSALSVQRSPSADTNSFTPCALSHFPLSPSPSFSSRPTFWHWPSLAIFLSSSLALFLLTAFNHVQGLGIAGLGILAVIVWRLIEWKRSALWWLIGGTIIINALFLWLYPRSAIIETYRAQGWLNSWYGFNILDISSSAGDRANQILGVFGIIGCATALTLFVYNHVAAWLVIVPIIALLIPITAVPFVEAIASYRSVDYVLTFQRMLLSAPSLLTPIACAALFSRQGIYKQYRPSAALSFLAMSTAFVFMLVTPLSKPFYNRMWLALAVVPDDLQLRPIWRGVATYRQQTTSGTFSKNVAALGASLLVKIEASGRPIWDESRLANAGPFDQTQDIVRTSYLLSRPDPKKEESVLIFSPMCFYTAQSFAGIGSTHWSSQYPQIAFTSGYRELSMYGMLPDIRSSKEAYTIILQAGRSHK